MQRLSTLRIGGLGHLESWRVHLAIVKLCAEEGPHRLAHFIDAAAADYRDVLYWAEYPNEAILSAEDRRSPEKLRAARKRDRDQYASWIGV
jgi:hypothetical protein